MNVVLAMKISIIILNWKRADDTIRCLKSIRQLKIKRGWKIEIVVVDNASSDGSVKKINKYLGKAIKKRRSFSSKVIESDKNLGFTGGNNLGIDHSLRNNSDYMLILNNDTEADKDMLRGLIKTAKRFPKAAAISPKIYFAKGYEFHKDAYEDEELGNVIWYAGGNIDWENVYGSNRGVDEVDDDKYMQTEPTDFATGACMLLRTEAIEQAGGFDDKYFMYLEDSDLSMRLKKAEWLVLYTPEAHLWHKVAQSSGIGSELNDYFIHRNRMLFGIRYAPIRTKLALFRESIKFTINGRPWQKQGIIDFYLGRFGKGSWGNIKVKGNK